MEELLAGINFLAVLGDSDDSTAKQWLLARNDCRANSADDARIFGVDKRSGIVGVDDCHTRVIRFTYCLYRSIPFFSSINFPSKISCNTYLHGIRCNLLTSDASITRKAVW